jgi:hypothetical protein
MNNVGNIYCDKIRLQIIIIGIVYQSIDSTSNDGEILISIEKVLMQERHYLKIFIEDDAYQIYHQKAKRYFLEFEHLTLENIKLLLEEEEGMLEINHNLNKGKKVTLLFPYGQEQEKDNRCGKNNVYPLF